MLLLDRVVPAKALLLEALLRRLPTNDADFQYYLEQLGRVQAGYKGEKWVDSAWQQMSIGTPYFLLHNLELVDKNGFTYQMDTVFICAYFALVIEIKNISGRLDYDQETHQCIRTRADGTQEGFSNAVDQVRRHAAYLKRILHQFNCTLPIEFAVVMSNSSTIIGNTVPYCPIFHVSGLQDFLDSLFHKYPRLDVVEEKKLKRVATKLKKLHAPRPAQLTYNKLNLRKGVLCEQCNGLCFHSWGKWTCSQCNALNQQAFLTALQDYQLLYGDFISNEEFRAYFNIESRHAAYRMLQKMNLRSIGSHRDKRYCLSERRGGEDIRA